MAVVGSLMVVMGLNNAPLMASIAQSNVALKGMATTATANAALVRTALVGIGIGAAVIGVQAIKSASNFQDAMTLIQTQAGASAAEVDYMTGAILKLAPAVGIAPQKLAEGLYHIESGGFRGAAALDVLTVAAKGAKIGNADLETTTNALVGTLNSGVGGFEGAGGAMTTLNAIIGAGNMRMEELTGALGTGILSTAATFGVSLQSVGAAIAAMTNASTPAEVAATRLRTSMALLGAPTAAAEKQLALIGLSGKQLAGAMRGPEGILGAIKLLSGGLAGLSKTDQSALISRAFGSESATAIMGLLNSLPKFEGIQAQITMPTMTLDQAWLVTMDLASSKIDKINASIDTLMIRLGDSILPFATSIVDGINGVATGVSNWAAANPKLAESFGSLTPAVALFGVAVAILGGPLTIILALLIAAVANMDKLIAGAGVVQAALGPQGGAQTFRDRFQAAHGRMPSSLEWGQFQAGTLTLPPVATVGFPAGSFNAPGFHAGEAGSPFQGPPTPGAMFGGGMMRDRTPITINHTTINQLDGREIGRSVSTTLYNDVEQYGSGFGFVHESAGR